ncbi:MAG: hypothetical protein AAGJ85_00295 [Pseudomonadota bacterium]
MNWLWKDFWSIPTLIGTIGLVWAVGFNNHWWDAPFLPKKASCDVCIDWSEAISAPDDYLEEWWDLTHSVQERLLNEDPFACVDNALGVTGTSYLLRKGLLTEEENAVAIELTARFADVDKTQPFQIATEEEIRDWFRLGLRRNRNVDLVLNANYPDNVSDAYLMCKAHIDLGTIAKQKPGLPARVMRMTIRAQAR